MYWWLIVIILVILAFVFLRVNHARRRTTLILLVVFLLFVYITAAHVFKQYDIDWKSASGLGKGAKVYFAWLGGAFGNMKTLTSNAIKMEWSQKNRTDTAVKIIEKQ